MDIENECALPTAQPFSPQGADTLRYQQIPVTPLQVNQSQLQAGKHQQVVSISCNRATASRIWFWGVFL